MNEFKLKEDQVMIYHNPKCGTSRNVLALIKNTGISPIIIEYLNNPPSKEQLYYLISNAGLTAKEALRKNIPEYEAIKNKSLTKLEIINHMVETPILINRPFVVTSKGVALCRPSEKVLDILLQPQLTDFYKEDGEKVI